MDDSPVHHALAQAQLYRMRLRAPELCYPSRSPKYALDNRVLHSLPVEDIRADMRQTGQAITAVLPIDADKRYVTVLYTAAAYARLLGTNAQVRNNVKHNPPCSEDEGSELRRFPTYHACIGSPLKTQSLCVRGDDLGRRLFMTHVEQCSVPLTPTDISAIYAFFSGSKRAPPSPSGMAMVRGTAYMEDTIAAASEDSPLYHKRGLYYTAARSTAGAVLGIVNLKNIYRPSDPEYLVVDPCLRDSFGCTYVPQEDFELVGQGKGAGALVLRYPGGPEAAWNGQIDAGLPLYTLASNHSWLLGFIHWNRPIHFASPLSYENLTRTVYNDTGEEVVILGITGQEVAMAMASGAYEPHTTKALGTSLDPIGAPSGTRFDLPDVIEAIREHTDDAAKMASLTMSHYVAEWLDKWDMMDANEVLVQRLQFQVDGEWVSQAEIEEMTEMM